MVFETDYTKSNNIMFKINPNLTLENQIYFEGHVGMFGIRQLVNISITNLDFDFQMTGKIFNSKYDFDLDVSAPYHENIFNALFTVRGKFPEM